MLLNLVASSLQRGGEFPLDLRVAVDPDHPDGHPILELLSRHSRRWKNVHMWLHPRSFNFLVGAKGNLPLLECLTLENATKSDAHYVDDIFEVAPRLNDVSLAGWLSKLPAIPWDQILDFRFENKESPALPLGMLRLLSTHTRTELLINASEITGPLEFPPVTSHISTFIITFTAASASSTRLTLGKILGCLTLPSLSKLRVACEDIQPLWNQTRFLDFATRSSLCNTLTSFEIDVMLDAPELLECISVLPLLEDLYLWDCDSQGNYRAIITDDLLYQLTWRDNQTNLVPRLNFVGLNSLMQFSDASLWDFVTSRIVPGRSAEGPFGAAVAYLLCCCREFSPEFIAQLSALEDAEEMEFHISSVRTSEE